MDRFSFLKLKPDDPFSFLPINEVGKMVVKELVVIENYLTGKFELFYKSEHEGYKNIDNFKN